MSTVTRAELRGISVGDLIVLHLNRAGDLNIVKEQIKLKTATKLEDGNVQCVLEPAVGTNWDNGPITVIIPPVKVDEIYDETVIDYTTLGDKTLSQILLFADLPPPLPTTVEVFEYNMLDPGNELKLKYRLTYTNAFFVGSLIVRISNAPNNLDSLRILNNIFIGEQG